MLITHGHVDHTVDFAGARPALRMPWQTPSTRSHDAEGSLDK
ncbi:hypothetical protein ACW0JT_13945 [Arthrobacter sp. SA17]